MMEVFGDQEKNVNWGGDNQIVRVKNHRWKLRKIDSKRKGKILQS